MTLRDGELYWTTYSVNGSAVEPWPAKLKINNFGNTTEYWLLPMDPIHPTRPLFSTNREMVKSEIRLLNIVGVPLFDDRTKAFQAYPSIKFTEIEAGMRKTASDMEELKAWVKQHGIKREEPNAEAT